MMTLDEIVDWERNQIERHDLEDLTDCVQLLRMLGWAAAFEKVPPRRAFIWFEDLDEFQPTIDLLALRAVEANSLESRALSAALARLYSAVHDALLKGPRRPGADEIVRRYVTGEVGDRTARYILGWDSFELVGECLKRGLPPVQVTED